MPDQEVTRWKNPFWVQVRAGVTTGSILLVITAVVGVIITQASNLDGGEALLYIGLPALVIVLGVVAFIVGRAMLRTARQWSAWQANVTDYVLDVGRQVRRITLAEVIQTAQVWEWKVYEDDDHDLVFESPGGELAYVRDLDPSPSVVAEHLHNTDPDHFPEEWVAFIADVGVDAVTAKTLAEGTAEDVHALQEQIARGEADLPRKLLQVRIADVVQEARRAGWAISWGGHEVVFEKGDDIATVSYANPEQLDVHRLRTVLDLPPS